MAASFRDRARAAAGGLLLAAAVLGATDALIASRQSAGIAPTRALPLCLTAPFAIALVVLAPAALVSAAGAAWRKEGAPSAVVSSQAALLLGVAGALAALLVGVERVATWSPSGATGPVARLPAVLLACGAFVACRRLAATCLRRVSAGGVVRLVAAAALLHAVAFAGAAAQWRREGRGIERDLLAGLARGAAPPAAAAGPRGPAEEPQAPPANLILVTIDTLRADHLDDARMPRTAALARDGVRLTQAFAASSWTLPSVASLMTGLPAARHGAGAPFGPDPLSRAPLDGSHETLASALRDAGFATRAVVTNPYLGLGYGLGRGFDAFENVTLESEAVLTLRPTVGFATLARLVPSLAIADRGDAVTARAARFLRAPHDGRFFLWLHYVDPHAPYDGETRSFRDELLAGGGATTRLPRMAQLRAGEVRPDADGRTRMRDAYARAVRFVDAQIGAIADLLEETGLASRTLLVVTADHGEELWDHGGVEHGHTLHDEVVRVPLVLRCPGCVPRGLRIDAPVATASLAPTLLDLLGVAVADGTGDASGLGGRGFAPLLRGETWTPSPIVSENLLFAEERVALRTARHTYVAWPNGKEELYDRARDPRELRDVGARTALLRRHRALLAATRDAAGSVASPTPSSPDDGARLRRALAALGYVE